MPPRPQTNFLKIPINIILPTTSMSFNLPSGLLSRGHPTKTLCAPLLFPIHATCPAHFVLPDLGSRTKFREGCRSQSSSLYSVLKSPVTSSLLGPNSFLNTLFLHTHSVDLRSSAMLRVVDCLSFTEVSGQRISPIFKVEEVLRPLMAGLIRCPQTSVRNYHSTLCNTPEERISHQHGGRSLKLPSSSVPPAVWETKWQSSINANP
jgi:hypothetical protein